MRAGHFSNPHHLEGGEADRDDEIEGWIKRVIKCDIAKKKLDKAF